MRSFCLSPSLLAADFSQLQEEILFFDKSQAEWLHLDIMDGHFVPNLSFGFPVITSLRPLTKKIFDVHLMISNPDQYLHLFHQAGADKITVHYEACPHLVRTLQQIKDLGASPAVAVNPHTPVSLLKDIFPYVEMILIMSVNPGFGGQKFIENSVQKVEKIRTMAKVLNPELLIEVDGGVGSGNIAKLVAAGADVLVAGNAVFAAENPEAMIQELKTL